MYERINYYSAGVLLFLLRCVVLQNAWCSTNHCKGYRQNAFINSVSPQRLKFLINIFTAVFLFNIFNISGDRSVTRLSPRILLFITMSRYMLTKMRSTPIGGLLALDFSIDFHKALGITTAILSCIHTLAHLIHICKLSINVFRGSKKIELQLNVKSSTSREND